MNLRSRLRQLMLDFAATPPWKTSDGPLLSPAPLLREAPPSAPSSGGLPLDEELTRQCRQRLEELQMPGAARLIAVVWNPRMRSTAGYAKYPAWRIELNPRLHEFEGQIQRTMLHELAHLVAYHRAGNRRIAPHGTQWRSACAELGIADESARHDLPLPQRQVRRRHLYCCPQCHHVIARVHKFARNTACKPCCVKHSRGRYDGRFRLVLLEVDPNSPQGEQARAQLAELARQALEHAPEEARD